MSPVKSALPTWTISSGEPKADTVPKIGPGGIIDGWFELFHFPLIDAGSGELNGVIEYVRNITDRKVAEDQLIDTYAKLKMALSISEMELWEWKIIDDRVVGLPARDTTSVSGPAFLDNPADFLKVVHPEDRESLESTISGTIAGWKSDPGFETEFRLVFPDGRVEWRRAVGRVIADDAGRPARLAGVGLNITRYKQLEKELRENEERLQLAIEGGDVGVWECEVTPDPVVIVSPKVLEILGFQGAPISYSLRPD